MGLEGGMNQLGVQETLTGDLRDQDEIRGLPSIQVFPIEHGNVQSHDEGKKSCDI